MVQASGAKHGFVLVLILIVELCVVRTRTRTFSYCTPLATWMAAIKLFSSAMRRSHFFARLCLRLQNPHPWFSVPTEKRQLTCMANRKKVQAPKH